MKRIGVRSFAASVVRRLPTWVLAGAVLLSALSVAAAAERVALVIGNAGYHDPDAMLRNPGNDADGMAAALRRLGFKVVLGKDLDTVEFDATIDEFAAAARGADVTLFFYAGHGLQMEGTNWLMPVNAKLNRRRDLERTAVRLNAVMDKMSGTKKIVFLDACRINPLARGLARSMGLNRSAAAERGLAHVEGVPGTLVVYATEANDVASDGDGDNSPFTEALLAHIETPGLDVFAMIDEVAQSVFKATNEAQKPSIQSFPMGLGSFYLASRTAQPADAAKAAYEAAKEVGTVAAFQVIVEDFPGSTYAKLAKAWVDKHVGVAPVAAAPSATSPEEIEKGLELSREERRLIQMGLAALGHDPGSADGVFGRRTRAALRTWQESNGLDATGYLTREQSAGLSGQGRAVAERLRAEAERERKARQTAASRQFSELLGRPFSPDRREVSVGWTDLHYAAVLDLPGAVEALCDAGMVADARLKTGSPLFGGDLKRTLAALGHDFENWYASGDTPLMIAYFANARNAAAALVACGADVEATTDDGWTLLHFAASGNATEAAKLLIDRGARVNAKNNEGWTPLDVALDEGDRETQAVLRSRGGRCVTQC